MPISESEALSIAANAVRMYAESHPRPHHVNQSQAAEMLNLSRPTVRALLHRGSLKLNECGMIPIEMIDRVRADRNTAT